MPKSPAAGKARFTDRQPLYPPPYCPTCQRGAWDDPDGRCACPTECWNCGGTELVVQEPQAVPADLVCVGCGELVERGVA